MTGVAGTIVLVVVAIAIVVLTVVLARLVRQLSRTAEQVEQLAHSVRTDLMPRVLHLIDRVDEEMVGLRAATDTARRVGESAERIATTLGEIVVKGQETITPIMDAVGAIGRPLRRGAAVMAGIKAGLSMLRRSRGD